MVGSGFVSEMVEVLTMKGPHSTYIACPIDRVRYLSGVLNPLKNNHKSRFSSWTACSHFYRPFGWFVANRVDNFCLGLHDP